MGSSIEKGIELPYQFILPVIIINKMNAALPYLGAIVKKTKQSSKVSYLVPTRHFRSHIQTHEVQYPGIYPNPRNMEIPN